MCPKHARLTQAVPMNFACVLHALNVHSGRVQPALAESWEQPDDTTYVFDLRDDVQFQDGTPMTAEDVVFSLEQARNETASPGFSGLLASVDTIEQSGDGRRAE